MKRSRQFSARQVTVALLGWLIVTNVFVALAHTTEWWPCKVILFLCLSFLPGIALLRAMCISFQCLAACLLYGFGLSILVLIVSGLTANQLLPIFGVEKPLELWGALGAWNVITLLIILACVRLNRQVLHVRKWPKEAFTLPTRALLGLSFLLPCIAVLGAFRLNNGGDGFVAILALCFGAMLIVYAIVLRHRLPDGVLAWLIFMIGLTVLLMTSLRGWDIVGHDIEREFRVFNLTDMHGRWDIRLDRNPYNACLSITILPEVLARLLDVSGLVVFKVILQIIFAACPVAIYFLLQQYVPKLAVLTGSLLFICYPTFINDSAMLTRQGVAYLFFALALLMMTNKIQKKRHKLLFLSCALGAILSHYSTAYVFVTLFAAAVICKLCIRWWQRRHSGKSLAERTVLSPLFAGLLFLMTFIWYTQVTATSSGVMITLQQSLANIPTMFSADNKSSDTSAALFFSGGKTQVDLYESYLMNARPGEIPKVVDDEYMPYLTSDDLPLTPLGEKVVAAGVNPSFIMAARQHFARILQVLALAGVVAVVYKLFRRKPDALGADFVCLSFAGIVLLTLLVVLPMLSISYGILRAFHQAMIFLLLPMMLFLVWVSGRMWPKLRTAIATTGIVVLFLMFSGVFAQMLGGVSPHLSMNNLGLYHGLYYSSAADAAGLRWLKKQVSLPNDVRAANFNKAFMHDPNYTFSTSGVLPSQIGDNTYVYLDPAQVLRHKVYTHFESSPLIIFFPLDYYGQAKDQIYSTTSTRIYR